MSSAVEAALAEIESFRPGWLLQREGLEDFARLNLNAPTRAPVDRLRVDLDHRLALCTAAANALRNLLADGYPALSSEEVDSAAMKDLTAQLESLNAALERFHRPSPAVGGEIVFRAA